MRLYGACERQIEYEDSQDQLTGRIARVSSYVGRTSCERGVCGITRVLQSLAANFKSWEIECTASRRNSEWKDINTSATK